MQRIDKGGFKMLTIKTWCLPSDLSEEKLKELHEGIVKRVVSIPAIGVKSEEDMWNLFPSDLMKHGLGNYILIEITRLPLRGTCPAAMAHNLVKAIGYFVKEMFPDAKVQCELESLKPSNEGFGYWSSE